MPENTFIYDTVYEEFREELQFTDDEMRAEGYDLVITEKEMRVLADHRREEFKDWMRPLFAPLED